MNSSSQLGIDPFAHEPTITSTSVPSGTCPPLLGRPWYPEGCKQIDPSCWHPYPTSWVCPSGIYPPLPTPTYQTVYPTGYSTGLYPTPTGIAPTGIAAATATASPLPSVTLLSKREAHKLAVKKRRAFEGPRHYHFPHYWPHYSAAQPVERFASTATGESRSHVSGTAYPSGTGAGVAPSGWMPTGTPAASAWPWASDHRSTTYTTSALTLPVESGIGDVV
jgi:hypothetical protein